jgi:hypothetical protein
MQVPVTAKANKVGTVVTSLGTLTHKRMMVLRADVFPVLETWTILSLQWTT